MKKFVMTDEKKHDLRELKITVIVLLSVAFLLGMFNWACYLIDGVYAKQLPLGSYLAHYPAKNLAEYKKTIKEFSVPTLNDIKSVYKEKEITGRYNAYLESAMRMYHFEYGTELDAECEAFFTKYVSDTGIGGYFGLIGRPGSLYEKENSFDYSHSTVRAQVLMPETNKTANEVLKAIIAYEGNNHKNVSERLRNIVGIGLPEVGAKDETEYFCIVLCDGIIELGFNESGFMLSQKQLVGDYSKSSVSKNLGMLVDLRNEAFAEE
jgi:hypothetical protein